MSNLPSMRQFTGPVQLVCGKTQSFLAIGRQKSIPFWSDLILLSFYWVFAHILELINKVTQTFMGVLQKKICYVCCFQGNPHKLSIISREGIPTKIDWFINMIYKHVMPSQRDMSTQKDASQWNNRNPSVHNVQKFINSVTVKFQVHMF